MQIKIFSAPKLHKALAQVRQDFGPESIILHRHKGRDENGQTIWQVHAARDTIRDIVSSNGTPIATSLPEAADAHKKLLNTMNQLERIVDGLGRQKVDSLRATLPDKASQKSFDNLMKLGVAPNYALNMAEDFSAGNPIGEHILQWGTPLDPTSKQEVVLLTGPSGSGKTTLAAKLAARFTMNGEKVAFLTTDTKRIGGMNDLQTYASSIGISMTPIRAIDDIAPALKQHSSARLVLVDSESWSVHQRSRLRRQSELWDKIPCNRKFLVLPANMDESDGMAIIIKAQELGINELACSKLDETAHPGKLINWAAPGLHISYCSFGPGALDQMGWLSARGMTALLNSHVNTREQA